MLAPFGQISQITRSIINKTHKCSYVPLTSAFDCATPNSRIHTILSQWYHRKEQEKRLRELIKAAKAKKLAEKYEINFLQNYARQCSKGPEDDEDEEQQKNITSHVTTIKDRRISPEFLALLKGHYRSITKGNAEEWLEPVRVTETRPKQSSQLDDAAKKFEENHPALTKYLRDRMERDDLMSKIYDINFYERTDPQSLKHILYTVSHIGKRGLSPEQLDKLNVFLEMSTQRSSEEFERQLQVLKMDGFLNGGMVDFMKKLLEENNANLNNKHLRKQLTALENVVRNFDANLSSESGRNVRPYGEGKQKGWGDKHDKQNGLPWEVWTAYGMQRQRVVQARTGEPWNSSTKFGENNQGGNKHGYRRWDDGNGQGYGRHGGAVKGRNGGYQYSYGNQNSKQSSGHNKVKGNAFDFESVKDTTSRGWDNGRETNSYRYNAGMPSKYKEQSSWNQDRLEPGGQYRNGLRWDENQYQNQYWSNKNAYFDQENFFNSRPDWFEAAADRRPRSTLEDRNQRQTEMYENQYNKLLEGPKRTKSDNDHYDGAEQSKYYIKRPWERLPYELRKKTKPEPVEVKQRIERFHYQPREKQDKVDDTLSANTPSNYETMPRQQISFISRVKKAPIPSLPSRERKTSIIAERFADDGYLQPPKLDKKALQKYMSSTATAGYLKTIPPQKLRKSLTKKST